MIDKYTFKIQYVEYFKEKSCEIRINKALTLMRDQGRLHIERHVLFESQRMSQILREKYGGGHLIVYTSKKRQFRFTCLTLIIPSKS